MRRSLVPAAVLAAGLALSACSSGVDVDRSAGADAVAQGEAAPIVGPEWSVTDLYLEPGVASTLPAPAAGAVSLAFGETSAVGATGCSRLQATVRFTSGEDVVPADEAERVTFDETQVDDPAPDCPNLGVHDTLVGLLAPGSEFDVTRRGPTEISLTRVGEEIDRPSIRLVAL